MKILMRHVMREEPDIMNKNNACLSEFIEEGRNDGGDNFYPVDTVIKARGRSFY